MSLQCVVRVFFSVFLSYTLALQVHQLEILKQQAKEEQQKQFEEERHQITATRNQEAAEHKKQLEVLKKEIAMQEKVQEVNKLCVVIIATFL